MVNYFIYAKDFSASTEGDSYYHDNGLKSFEEFKRDVEKIKKEQSSQSRENEPPVESKIIYLHWGDRCWEVDENEIIQTYNNKASGRMGTYPECIIKCLKENYINNEYDKIKLLYLITDGLIYGGCARQCFILNEDMYYETIIFHAFNANPTRVDMSVAASFLKSRCIVYRNYELFGNTDISKDFDYGKISVDNFAIEKDELHSYIKFKFIKNFKNDVIALQEIDKLKKLRDRLFDEMASIKDSGNSNLKLDTKDRNEFLRAFVNTEWYKNLQGAEYVGKVYIEKSISTLINYIVSEAKSYSFDAIKFNNKYDQTVQEEHIVDINFAAEQEIEFPDIILDDDKGIPVVILTKLNLLNKIIFHGMKEWSSQVSPASFNKFKSTMDCPLFLVKDSDVSESIGYFYTLNVYKQFLASNTKTEPRTRRPFHGGIVLTDTDQFNKYNDYILSATYFDSKKVNYNVGLFYYVLWKNCDSKEWMDRNVVEQFKKYVMRRISETVCKIGLSSLPLDPQEKTSLLTALWYCTELSSCIFKNDSQNFYQERLRMYHGIACYMVEILKYFNYNLDLESIEKRRELISYVMTLKKISKHSEKVYYLLEGIFKSVEGFLVSDIEKPFNIYKLNYLKFNHREMLRDDVLEEMVHLNDYVHLMHIQGDLDASKARNATFDICEKTFRPFFAIDCNKSFYTDLFTNTKKVVIKNDHDQDKIQVTYEAIDSLEFDRILSLYKLFINCVEDLKKYPTLSEYGQYVSNKKKFHKDLVTIFPSNVYSYLENIYKRYQEIVVNVDIRKFIKVSKAYVDRNNRIKAEGKMKYNNDYEIKEFIANEELKVNLKK